MGGTIPGIGRRPRKGATRYEPPSYLTLEEKWKLFDDAYQPAFEVVRECAKYQYYWDQRTIWLGENSHLLGTSLYEERKAKRLAMAPRWSELRLDFIDHAANVQDYAVILGDDYIGEIKARYGVDYTRIGYSIDVYLVQWKEVMVWNPEPVPF